jgi:hypothetical protein
MDRILSADQREHLEEWIAALRSGRYKQGRNSLRLGDLFCCLGVGCDLHAKATGTPWIEHGNEGLFRYRAHGAILPPAVAEYYGLPDGNTFIPHETLMAVAAKHGLERPVQGRELTFLNDKGWPFPAIADCLEIEMLGVRQEEPPDTDDGSFDEEPPDPDTGPQVYIRYDIGTRTSEARVKGERVIRTWYVVNTETNDDNDDGWPDDEVITGSFGPFYTLAEALNFTHGVSRIGAYGQPVDVYLDGEKLTEVPEEARCKGPTDRGPCARLAGHISECSGRLSIRPAASR